jgi:SsrA-binding protein
MILRNKRANFDYSLEKERYEAGISLKGVEVKSLRAGRGNISNSHIRILNGEVFLVNADIPTTGLSNYDATRSRKLLLHKNEILSILTKIKQDKLVIVPVKLYNTGKLFKLKFALGKAKKRFEKRASLKKKDIEREIKRELKN